jgi:CheY-like chemotaxis protein
MDVRLIGDKDGIEAAIDIWQRFGIRSLFVSANLDPAARAKAAAANPVGFLEKPFTAHSLLAAVGA